MKVRRRERKAFIYIFSYPTRSPILSSDSIFRKPIHLSFLPPFISSLPIFICLHLFIPLNSQYEESYRSCYEEIYFTWHKPYQHTQCTCSSDIRHSSKSVLDLPLKLLDNGIFEDIWISCYFFFSSYAQLPFLFISCGVYFYEIFNFNLFHSFNDKSRWSIFVNYDGISHFSSFPFFSSMYFFHFPPSHPPFLPFFRLCIFFPFFISLSLSDSDSSWSSSFHLHQCWRRAWMGYFDVL